MDILDENLMKVIPSEERVVDPLPVRGAGRAPSIDRPHTREELLIKINQLEGELALTKMSQSALLHERVKIKKVSASRLRRMKNRSKLLMEARAIIMRLQNEAHGG